MINKKPDNILLLGFFYRAGDEVRTRDIQLGRLTLYQLSYSRNFYTICYSSVGRTGFEPVKVKTSRFTVCPRWPLEYLPKIFFNERLVI